MRRWGAGDWLEIDGVRFRVCVGRKAPDDLRLEWLTENGWRPVSMMAGALLADFFWENEEHLYPQANGYLGGNKYLKYLRHAAIHGYGRAEAGLRAERVARPRLWMEGDAAGEA